MTITDDLQKLLDILPQDLRQVLESHPKRDSLVEVVLDLGRRPEARFPNQAEYLSETPVTQEQIDDCIERVGIFGGDNRAGIEQTLHRISAIRNRTGKIIGLTCRVGRAVFGTIGMIRDLVETGKSILMLGRPGVGKTTALREIARVLADELQKRVVIIDTSNEIAGDGDVAHPAIGRARRMQVAHPNQQHQVMIEAVENHMPEVIVIDEIGTELEALAARTIAERGVQLVGTAHGNQIENLIKNPTLADLVGGIQAVTLGDDEARRRGSQKTVLERKAPPTFEIAVEMLERQRWVIHESVADTVDNLLRGRQPNPQTRTVDDQGKVAITRQLAVVNGRGGHLAAGEESFPSGRQSNGWRSSGQMLALPQLPVERVTGRSEFDRLLDESFNYSESIDLDATRQSGPNGEDLPLHIYPYGVSRHQLEQVISVLTLPVVLTKDIDSADAILALRSHVKNHAKLRQMAKARHVPIHMIKSSTIPQITRGLRRLLNIDDPELADDRELQLFLHSGSDDEMDALEEARLAVEQIVIPKGQPVELLPRSPQVRKMQHELVEHYRLKSHSFGEEPNRRLRIYPA
ncbi:single-stranded nucleic acid binding R3H domain-containing protein [Nostoc linckia z18]|uniref:Single-stranded nucleic acid binding R3H domain-containing protein n=2 Tax=Nostoc linckia TaxID=92942 RepID=A0A9Q5ZD89_NOSLI|nr:MULTISPECIES: R3H domain-containing nucleic acid-binding protein [Nostoc]PHK40850.1 single-stranded nucleic acid binding R3H domain-containing protein [Nostoc linckia z15]PHK47578.1 single-stranded nucleic acid binding R3H domain-containing protein [Nostoc linckia z16]MBC1237852.1 AAA family ATPase [Nostoc sp. 2RC]PHJ61167.1 single-stranded nucleic acid binding R3H domain-containing protein [Nostoc linckia z1]PHJ62321.1 single-stranded nucleic acid binding R3H domain-containing protein [Nos